MSVVSVNLSVRTISTMQISPQNLYLAEFDSPENRIAHFYTFISLICLGHEIVRHLEDKKSKSVVLHHGPGR